MMNRKKFIVHSLTLATWALSPSFVLGKGDVRYKVGVIDLMLLKRQKLSAVQLAQEIGADGLEVDMGGLGNRVTFENKFKESEFLRSYQNELQKANLAICAMAMTGFYAQSLAERINYIQPIQDCFETMKKLGVTMAFLPLGVSGDLVKNPNLWPVLVDKLKAIGKLAKTYNVTVAIETALPAIEEKRFLIDIGQTAIKSYFNFSNALKNGRDLIKELQTLGKKYIAQIHCTDDDGLWLQDNKRLDLYAVKKCLDQMNWKGWLVIERSRRAEYIRDVKMNYSTNTKYVKEVFQ